jgi:hypothetical protein
VLAAVAGAGALLASLAAAGPASAHRAADATATAMLSHGASRVTGSSAGNPFCAQVGARYRVSAGAEAFCFGPQPTTGGARGPAAGPGASGRPANVDAASLAEDVTHGVRAYGQAEVSVAAAGKYVVEAWNDSTGFFAACGSPHNQEELTGIGFSANGGKSFTDLGGLPNKSCAGYIYEGDPAVTAYQANGQTWFYVASLFDRLDGTGASEIAMAACRASAAALSCGQPVVIANSSHCAKQGTHVFCDFLDKDFLALDPARHRLYATYTDFPSNFTSATTSVNATLCDLANPAKPACEVNAAGTPEYETLVKAGASPCESEGAYPAVDPKSGDLYAAYEFNWGSSMGTPACSTAATPVRDVVDRVPYACLTRTKLARCGVARSAAVAITSMEGAWIPGYSRFPGADFPRIAVSDLRGTVSIVWNDSRYHPLGDILLQSFNLGSLTPVQHTPVILDKAIAGGMNFLPALRLPDANGNLDVTWFSRATTRTADTDVYGALGINPRATSAPRSVTRITNVASDWLYASSDIDPNFGDYTDNYVSGSTLYVAWSDGRLAVPQPFEAHLPA